MSKCEYCQDDRPLIDNDYGSQGYDSDYLAIKDNSIYVEVWAEGLCACATSTKVNYCPMCGRKLGDD